jgi:hypothetical protein
MKYIIFTFDGGGLPLAYHLSHEGHEVLIGQVTDKRKTRSEEPTAKRNLRLKLYKNLLEILPANVLIRKMKQIPNPQEYFVFFDYNSLYYLADQIRDLGFHGIFPTEADYIFEVDRDAAKEFVKKYYPDIEILGKKKFNTVNSAKRFLKNSDKLWVIKSQGRNDGPTFVPSSNDLDLARWQVMETLDAFDEYYEESGFILEEKVLSPIEITPEKIYYDGVPLNVCLNFENKPLGSENLSLQTGCAADLVFPIEMKSKIHDIAFPPIVDELAKQHKGLFLWDASLLFDQNTGRIYFGEFCPNRPWYNSFFTYLSQMPSANHFFESVVAKKNPFTLGTVGASASLFNLSRDPHEGHLLSGASVNYPDQIHKDIWLYNIYKKNQSDRIRILGYDWELGAITGSGKTIDEAVNRLYENVANFSLAGVYYRPKTDFLSLEYPTSILNRVNYGIKHRLYQIPFPINVWLT